MHANSRSRCKCGHEVRFKHQCFLTIMHHEFRFRSSSCSIARLLFTYVWHTRSRSYMPFDSRSCPDFFVSRYLYCTNYRSLLLDIKLILLSMEEGHHSGAHWRKDEILSLIAIWREDKIFEETKSTVDKKGGVHHHIRKITRSWFSAKCETDSKQDPFPSPRI